jgi:chaperonin GroEL (HSP60 family)
MELATRLHAAADKVQSLEAYAYHKFAEALEVVPRTLAENSGQNATAIIAKLYAEHAAGRDAVGVDVDGAGTKDAVAAGVLDSLAVKAHAIKLAAETAITVLRVDQIIMSVRRLRRGARACERALALTPPLPPSSSACPQKQAGGPKPKAPGQGGDDD